jgi:membrane protein DedA with SNARE-associated domain
MCRLPWLRVLALAALGCAVWNGLLIWGGYLLGENWPLISQFLTTYDISFLFLGLLLLGWWILRAKFSQGPK